MESTPTAQAIVTELVAREADGLDVIVRLLRGAGLGLVDVDLTDPLYPLVVVTHKEP